MPYSPHRHCTAWLNKTLLRDPEEQFRTLCWYRTMESCPTWLHKTLCLYRTLKSCTAWLVKPPTRTWWLASRLSSISGRVTLRYLCSPTATFHPPAGHRSLRALYQTLYSMGCASVYSSNSTILSPLKFFTAYSLPYLQIISPPVLLPSVLPLCC
jgi:hypothetical protein